ncbi:MAG: hypothetical protein HZA88_11415 [Verrucomicrobia bacterium]|nr:hypothetical protein [Verrucomicrobiota bacterium]
MKLTFYCQSCSQKLNIGHSQIGTIVRCPACDMNQPVITPLAKRYRGMRIAVVTLQILGVVIGLVLASAVLVLMTQYQLWSVQQLGTALLVLGLGLPLAFGVGITIYAAGEGVKLLVDLEDNVRAMRLYSEMARAERQPPPPVEAPQQPSQ